MSIGGRDTDALRIAVPEAVGEVASIGILAGGAFVQARSAAHPVFVNGERVSGSRPLEDGDRIRIGEAEIDCEIRDGSLCLEAAGGAAPLHGEEIVPASFRPSGGEDQGPPAPRVSRGVLAVGGAGLVLLALAWFSFTSVSVELSFEPPAEDIWLPDTLLDFSLSDHFLVRPGTHTVAAERTGYHPFEAVIEVGPEAGQRFSFALAKLPGRLFVETEPVDGAAVLIDGEPVGTTPLAGVLVEPGVHQLVVDARRHIAVSIEIEIAGADAEHHEQFTLVPAWAPVTIETVPAGAQVHIDGVLVGETPDRFELDAGVRKVELLLAAHNPWLVELTVMPDEPQSLEVALVEADGRLQLETRPSDAQVIVGDDFVGRTPLELLVPAREKTEITILKPGYAPEKRSVELDPGEERELSVVLAPRFGVIGLVTSPADASVTVDGRAAGSATQRLRLLAVAHRLVIRHDGYAPYKVTVTPRPGLPEELRVNLKKLGAGGAPVPNARIIKTSLGNELVRVDPGEFVMGSPRGEAGRRANETQRPVRLSRRYYIGATEVSNAEFRQYAPDHAAPAHAGFELSADAQPVVNVTWEDAARFCNWLSQRESLPPAYVESKGTLELVTPVPTGYRLPSEAEWTWAARYAAGAWSARFPWGDNTEPESGSGNYADASAAGIVPSALMSYEDGFPVTAPIGKGPTNPLGLSDVGGNAAEWVHDRYTIYAPVRGQRVSADPFGPDVGKFRVVRGSSWRHSSVGELRLAYRDYSEEAREDVGFRIARYAE